MTGGEPAREPMSELVAQSLARSGLTTPALLFLELHRPVAFAAGQCAIFFQPLLGFVVGDQRASQFSQWLSDEDGIDCLIRRLAGGQDASSILRRGGRDQGTRADGERA